MKHRQYTVCFACRRPSWGKQGKPPREVCLECSYVANMTQLSSKELDAWEQAAIYEMAAQVREPLGMAEEEAFEFVRFVFLGVGDGIREQQRSGKPPF